MQCCDGSPLDKRIVGVVDDFTLSEGALEMPVIATKDAKPEEGVEGEEIGKVTIVVEVVVVQESEGEREIIHEMVE